MTADLKNVRELHQWNRRILSIGGMWPMEPSFIKFYIGFVYFVLHLIMALGDFVNVFGDMTLMIANLSETSVQGMVGVKMLVLRHSVTLTKIIKQVEDGARGENYRDSREQMLYLEYNKIGRRFFRVLGYLAFSTVLMYHLKPFEDVIKAAIYNETTPFILPYRMRLFFNISDTRTYALVYISESPMFYYYYCHTISVCFFCTLIVHVAGELSVLAHRIRSINEFNSSNDFNDPKIAFRDVAIKHQQIIG
uniref:Odorant receptor n=1 Tax=Campoletis chlorideae TaxID=219166 RepID=A0A346D480_9HYME|nr:odorant receptor [Campoletis chlorideae]